MTDSEQEKLVRPFLRFRFVTRDQKPVDLCIWDSSPGANFWLATLDGCLTQLKNEVRLVTAFNYQAGGLKCEVRQNFWTSKFCLKCDGQVFHPESTESCTFPAVKTRRDLLSLPFGATNELVSEGDRNAFKSYVRNAQEVFAVSRSASQDPQTITPVITTVPNSQVAAQTNIPSASSVDALAFEDSPFPIGTMFTGAFYILAGFLLLLAVGSGKYQLTWAYLAKLPKWAAWIPIVIGLAQCVGAVITAQSQSLRVDSSGIRIRNGSRVVDIDYHEVISVEKQSAQVGLQIKTSNAKNPEVLYGPPQRDIDEIISVIQKFRATSRNQSK